MMVALKEGGDLTEPEAARGRHCVVKQHYSHRPLTPAESAGEH